MKNFWKKVNETDIRHIAAVLIIIGVFGLVMLQHFVEVPVNNVESVKRATDQLIVLGFAVVVGYLFMNQKKEKPESTQSAQKPSTDQNEKQ